MMRVFHYFLFIAVLFCSGKVSGQCNPPDKMPAWPTCWEAPFVCFPGLCYTTPGHTIFSPPNPGYCGPGSAIYAPHFFQFTPIKTTVTFDMNATCGGPKSNDSVEIAVILPPDNCQDWGAANVVFCQRFVNNGIFVIPGLLVGKDYLLCINAVENPKGLPKCVYTFNTVDGVAPQDLIDEPISGMISGPDKVCPGQTVHFTLNWKHPNAYFYNWRITSLFSSITTPQPKEHDFPEVDMLFGSFLLPGFYNVCVFGYNNCDSTDQICKVVEVREVHTDPVSVIVCKEKLPYTYPGVTPPLKFTEPGVHDIAFKTPEGCDSIVHFTIDVPLFDYDPLQSQNTAIICKGTYTFPANGKKYGAGLDQQIVLKSKASGCDSIVYLSVGTLDPFAKIVFEGKLSCRDPKDSIVILQGWETLASSFNPALYGPPFDVGLIESSYAWKDSTGKILAQGVNAGEIIVRDPGKYKLIYTVTAGSITCSDSTTIFVPREEIPPVVPILTGPNSACQGAVNQVFTVTNPDSLFYTIEWILPSGASIQTNTADSVSINVKFDASAATGMQSVCAVVHTPCGKDTTCFPVEIAAIPTGAIKATQQSICLGSSIDLQFLLPGIGQYDVVYSDGTSNFNLNGIDSGLIVNVHPTTTTTYTIVSIGTTGSTLCPNLAPGASVQVAVSQPSSAQLTPLFEVCNAVDPNNIIPTSLNFNTLIASGATGGTWQNIDNPAGVTGILPNLDFKGVNPGSYSFTYTLDNPPPCSDSTYTISLTVRDCKCPSIAVAPGVSLCNDNDQIDLNTLKGTGNTEPGKWNILFNTVPGAGLAGSILDVTGAGSGVVVVQFELTTAPPAGCPDTSSPISIIVNKAPFINLVTATADVCNVDPSNTGKTILNFGALFLGAGTDAGAWTDPLGVVVATPNAFDFNGSNPGDVLQYTYTVKGVPPCTDKSIKVNITIKDCGCPDASTNAPSTKFCTDGGPINLSLELLDPVPPKVGTWSIITNVNPAASLSGNILTINGAGVGSILVRFTLSNIPAGCPGYSEQLIELVAVPTASFIALDTVVCNAVPADPNNGSPFLDLNDLVIGGDLTGAWTLNGTPVSTTLDFTGLTPGTKLTYIYTTNAAIAPCGNKSYSLTINVIDCDCPNQNTKKPIGPICNNNGFLDLSTLLFNNPDPGTWKITGTPAAGSDPFAVLTGNNFDASGAQSGIYQVTFTLTNTVSGCIDTSQQYIVVEDVPYAGQAFSAKHCVGEQEIHDLFAELVDADPNGTWIETSAQLSTGNAFHNLNGTFDIDGQIAGTYSFEYNLTGGVSCPDAKQTISIQINAVPLADAGIDAVLTCAIADALLGGNSSSGTNIKYDWKELGGGSVTNPSGKTIKVNQEGEYEIKVSDALTGCFSMDTVSVNADNQVITAVPSDFDDPSCFNACDGFITIDPTKITGGNPPFELSLNGGAFSTKFDFQDLCDGIYNIVVRDQSDCEFTSGFTLKSPPDIQVNFGPDQVITGDNPIIIKPVFSLPIADIVTIVVVDEDGAEVCTGADCSELSLQPTATTTYTITVTDANGCSDSDQMNILVAKEQVVFVPSGFTPNGDGQNDVLMIFGSDLLVKQIKSFQIFNRWGDVLFSEKNFPINDPKYGWDGKFKGQKLNPGVFVYVAEVEFLNGEESSISGDVTISGVSN